MYCRIHRTWLRNRYTKIAICTERGIRSYQYLCILFFVLWCQILKKDQKEWKLLAEKAECVAPQHSGYEGWKGYLSDVDSCAEACNGESSMFTFGTNDFGFKKCRYNETIHDTLYDGCECRCQLLAHPNGTCEKGLSGSPGYRLYKIQKGTIIVRGIESTYEKIIIHRITLGEFSSQFSYFWF